MKASALLLAFAASASAASSPCALPTLFGTLAPLAAQIPACKDASGYDVMLLATGTPPTTAQIQKLETTQTCKDLYSSMQKTVTAISPACTVGGIESSTFTSVPVAEGIPAFIKALAGSPLVPGAATGNSTSGGNATITTAPGNGTSKNTSDSVMTPAPSKPSSATVSGVALTAAAMTMFAVIA